MPDTNARRRADVLRADAADILRLIERLPGLAGGLKKDRQTGPGVPVEPGRLAS